MRRKHNPYLYLWVSTIILTTAALLFIMNSFDLSSFFSSSSTDNKAINQNNSIEDASSLIEAIFSVVLAFSTISTIIRADMQVNKTQDQIDLAQRIEFRHSLIADVIDQNLIFFNISKYPIIINSLHIELPEYTHDNDLLRGKVINPGEQASISLGIINKNIKDVFLLEPTSLQHEPTELTTILLKLEYNYGGSGSITYHKSYKFHFENRGTRKNFSINPQTAQIQLDEFYYKIPARNHRNEKKVTISKEWDIPLPLS